MEIFNLSHFSQKKTKNAKIGQQINFPQSNWDR